MDGGSRVAAMKLCPSSVIRLWLPFAFIIFGIWPDFFEHLLIASAHHGLVGIGIGIILL